MKINSEKLISKRKEEIINACGELYKIKNFKDITLKEISDLTTFTRTSIYNYFQTKEEIFLTLNKIEYEKWCEDLNKIIAENKTLTKEDIAENIAKTLEKREQMLKLMSMNHFEMEANSRLEILTEFKIAYGNSIKTVKKLLEKFCPDMVETDINEFIYAFFPFVYGIYPYAKVTDCQKKAMEQAQTGFIYHSIYELSYNAIRNLLG